MFNPIELVDNPETPKIYKDIPLRTLINEIYINIQNLAETTGDYQKVIEIIMKNDKPLVDYLKKQMNDALNPNESTLIAQASLVAYRISIVTPPEIDDSLSNEGIKPNHITMISVIEDDICQQCKDKNGIYIALQREMVTHPALAIFITELMKQSVSLEEANIIGKTALETYLYKNFFLSFDPNYSDNEN